MRSDKPNRVVIAQTRHKSYSEVIVMKGSETEYRSTLPNADILNFISDLKASRKTAYFILTKGHELFIEVKKLGFTVEQI